jgi:hypothetical protein
MKWVLHNFLPKKFKAHEITQVVDRFRYSTGFDCSRRLVVAVIPVGTGKKGSRAAPGA